MSKFMKFIHLKDSKKISDNLPCLNVVTMKWKSYEISIYKMLLKEYVDFMY